MASRRPQRRRAAITPSLAPLFHSTLNAIVVKKISLG
jgi:hypothetical protein